MKHLFLLAITLSFSAVAQAEWTFIAKSEGRYFSRYIESTSLEKTSAGIKFWSLMDFTEPQSISSGKYRSSKFQQELDCKGKRIRLLSGSFYAKNQAQGSVIFVFPTKSAEWNPVNVNTITEDVMRYVCKQKVTN